jgi:hypothetical protein
VATVKGVYTFKDTLTPITFGSQNVNFVATGWGSQLTYLRITGETYGVPCLALAYVRLEDGEYGREYYDDTVYFYSDQVGPGKIGWFDETTKNIDFGETPQTVSDEFYGWLLENTEPRNTPIYISTNGTTTLATAGKYCDRNIDVNVNVPSKDAELAEQKAITDSILDKSITEFTSDTLTRIGANGFYYCESLHTFNCPQVNKVNANAFRGCTALQKLDFPLLADIFGNAFAECSNLDTLIPGLNKVCKLNATNAFLDTPIANGTGYIYVPYDLVESYKTATNWSTFADQIKPISELEE